MMDIQDKPEPKHDGARQIASEMSEAVSYLIAVALSAGLGDVARKLNDVNTQLQCMQLEAIEDELMDRQGRVKH